MNENLNPLQFRKDQDEFDRMVHVAETEHGKYTVSGHGAGRMKWSVEYPDGDYALGQTKREVVAEAHLDFEYRRERK